MKSRRWWIAAIVVVALGATAWVLAGRAAPVRMVAVATAPLQQALVFSGRVETPIRVELGATVTGRVAEVLVREGATVRAGALLARLESDELQAQAAQAGAALEIARARLASQRELARPSSEAALAQATAVLDAARRDARRSEELLARGYVSEARVDEARRAVQVAQAQVDSARAAARANAGEGTETAQARLRVREAEAALAMARAKLAQTRVVAPADGRIVSRSVDPGQIVQPGRALFAFAATGITELVAQADEKFIAQLAPGQTARVVADAFPDRPFGATLASIAPGIDAARGSIEVKFQVADPPPFLREDMTLSLAVEVGRKAQAITLPAGAVIGSGAEGRVRLLSDGRVVERPVRIGLRTPERVEVVSGLAPGQQVLADPLAAEPGQRARPARDGEMPAAGKTSGSGGESSGPAAAMGAAAGAR